MDSVIKTAFNFVRLNSHKLDKDSEKEYDASTLIADIHNVCNQIDNLEAAYELQSDEDLVESFIYEILAKKAKYRYLLKKAKTLNIRCTVENFPELNRSAG